MALAVVVGIIVENAASQSRDTEWNGVAIASVFLALLCLVPVLFASTPRSYRTAAAVIAALLTVAAVHGIVVGNLYAVPAAVVAWLTTLPVREVRTE